MNNTFEVKTPLFEGPFDLLLFFIKRDEIDIYDIPISKITDDFLDYVKRLELLNIELASEFILVAATLMSIKAKMLLPRTQVDEQGEEIDPRQDLVRHLLEYKKYKSVVEVLESWESKMLEREKRGNTALEINKLSAVYGLETEMQDVDLYKLMIVFQKVMNRHQLETQKPAHQVVQYPFTIEEQKSQLLVRLALCERLSFEEIFQSDTRKIAIVYNFLAVLELLQNNLISIVLGLGYNNFWISLPQIAEENMQENDKE